MSTASRRALNARVGSLLATVIAANVLARSALPRASVALRGIDPALRPSLQRKHLSLLPYCFAQLGGNVSVAAIGLERIASALDPGPPEQGCQLLCTFRVPTCCPADELCRGFQFAVRQLISARRSHP